MKAPRVLSTGSSILAFNAIAVLIAAAVSTGAAPPPSGVAPVAVPAGGFGIDGELFANTPAPGTGDWVADTNAIPGPGGAVLSLDGISLNPTVTFHFRDAYNGGDEIFTRGMKWKDNPNNWYWTIGKASSKTDINNVLLHLATDSDGHTWAVIAADRLSVNGDSYIDFEFLQSSLERTETNKFVSAGPDGGRTVGDILLSLAFVGGGKIADFYAWRWQPDGGGFTYVDVTAALPVGRVFVALNSNIVSVPYGAFGKTEYEPNAFVEAAIDLTALIGSFDPCQSFGFNAIMVKTKSSASDSASIEDFVDPIAYKLRIGPSADAGPDQAKCSEGGATAFVLRGSATQGVYPVAATTWSVLSGQATIDRPDALVTTVRVSSASATLRLTVTQQDGCVATDDVVLNVVDPPPCTIIGPATTCPRELVQYLGPPNMGSYSWSVTGNGAALGPTNGQNLTVVAGDRCGESFTVTLQVTSNVCSVACTLEVVVMDTVAPELVCPPDMVLECPVDPTPDITGTATVHEPCSGYTLTYSDSVSNVCGGTRIIKRTWVATDECGNSSSCVQTITVRDTTPPSIACPPDVVLECPADTGTNATGIATASDLCGLVSLTFNDTVSNICGGAKVIWRTWTATDECGNSSSCVQTITVRDTTPPVITCPPSVVLECPTDTSTNATGSAHATDACGSVTITHSDVVSNLCGGARVIRRTWTATDECGNSSSCIQTITVGDTTPPVINCPADLVLECPADTGTNRTGVATAVDACGQVTVVFSDVVSNGCGASKVVWRTWTATDECGNSASCVQTIRVRDTTPPVITCPPSLVLECPAETSTNLTGVATAFDECGSVTITYSDVVSNGCGGSKIIWRTWRATDQCGNSSSCVQTIRVRDTTPPVITCAPDLVLECPADTGTNVTGVATALDICSPVTIRYNDAISNTCGGAKVIKRTWIATDACGNSASCIQTITVRDTVPPTIICPPDAVLECGANTAPSAVGTATARDACGAVDLSYSDSVSNICGGAKVITRTWTAADRCGNRTNCVQRIIVLDTTPPELVCRLVCTYSQGGWSGGGTPAKLLATHYTNLFPQGITLGIYHPANGNAPPNGLHWEPNAAGLAALQAAISIGGGSGGPITQDALNPTDTYGAAGLGRQMLALTLNIAFNTAGLLGAGPNDFGSLVYSKPGDTLDGKTVGEILEIANRALAGLGLPPGYDFSSLSGLINNLNLSFYNCTPSSFATAFLSPPSMVVPCFSQVPAPNPSYVSASDACSGVTVSALPDMIVEQSCPNRLVILRTWVARDACGNTNMCSHRIVVNDTNPPVLVCPPDRMLTCPADTGTNVTGVATATDNCGPVTVSYSDTVSSVCGGAKVISRAWTAVDACANVATGVQTIMVVDATPPVMSLAPERMATNGVPWDFDTPVAADECGAVVVRAVSTVTNQLGPDTFSVTRTWEAIDECGNRSVARQTVTVLPAGDRPALQIMLGSTHKIIIRWPATAAEFRLESSPSCASSKWTPVAITPILTNGFYQVEITNPPSVQFYRLSKAPPVLEARVLPGGRLQLAWPTAPPGFELEATDSLVVPNWAPLGIAPVASNAYNYVDVPLGSPWKFFRLCKRTL